MSAVVLAASHGTSSLEGREAVRRLVQRVSETLPLPVVACHVDVEEPDVAHALASATADRAVVVPLLLSAGYHLFVDLAESAADAPLPTVVTRALGPDARLVDVLLERLRIAGVARGDTVILAAAGSSDPRAVQDCRRTAELLGGRLGTRVEAAFVSAADPRLPDAIAAARRRRPGARIVVATYLLAPGYFADLVSRAGADLVSAPLLTAASTPDELVDLVVDRAVAELAELALSASTR